MRDSQLTELSGRHFLIAQLVLGGLEVAIPARDRGVDLIAYLDLSTETKRFVSCPIQMKASQEARFSLDRKYEKIAGLLLAFVWHIEDPSKACVYARDRRMVEMREVPSSSARPSGVNSRSGSPAMC
jgi:hypothetical protein